MKNLTIKLKLVIIVISTILIVSIAMFVTSYLAINHISQERIDYCEKQAYESKLRNLKSVMSLQMKYAQDIYDDYQNGLITEEVAKREIYISVSFSLSWISESPSLSISVKRFI